MRLSAAEGQALLQLARASAEARVRGQVPPPVLRGAAGALGEPGGALVTLRLDGAVRGSAGWLASSDPLAATVARAAAAAAGEDPRFEPLRPADLPALAVEVAALGPARREPLPGGLRTGTDAVVVRLGWRSGVLLPRAAPPGLDAAELLGRACLAAGLPPDAWRSPEVEVQLHAAEELSSHPSFGAPAPAGLLPRNEPGPRAG